MNGFQQGVIWERERCIGVLCPYCYAALNGTLAHDVWSASRAFKRGGRFCHTVHAHQSEEVRVVRCEAEALLATAPT